MNDNIWLVIWDLDCTFFRTESDNRGSEPIEKYVEVIKNLIDRGIMSACCSRSSLQTARNKLEELGIWDSFVFPSINENAISKAERVEGIIKNARLRSQQTLYLDENAFNRKLAQAALPQINTALPNQIFSFIDQPEMKGFVDKFRVRLSQYKLAGPIADGKRFADSRIMAHADMECSIVSSASYIPKIQGMFDECIRLNYIGDHPSIDEINSLLNAPDVQSGCITLKDFHEDRGVVGFYAKKEDKLLQFIFSSILLDIPGVEQWAYAELEYPSFTKSKDCIGDLDVSGVPSWINQSKSNMTEENNSSGSRLLLRGSTELDGIERCLKKYISTTSEFFDGPTSICYAAKIRQLAGDQKKQILQDVPSLDSGVFSTAMFTGEFDYVLMSVLSERSIIKYTHKTDHDLSVYIPKEHLGRFSSELVDKYESSVYDEEELKESLQYICDNLPKHTSLVLITAPEIEFARLGLSETSGPDRFPLDFHRRRLYNSVAEKIVMENNNAYLLDIRNLVKTEADLKDFHILNYNPQVDYELSRVLATLMGVKIPVPNRIVSAPALTKAELTQGANLGLQYRSFIVNGIFVTQIEQEGQLVLEYSFTIMNGSQEIAEAGFSTSAIYETEINAFGVYWARVGVKHSKEVYYFDTSYLVYNEKTAFNYLDKTAPNYNNIYRGHLRGLYDDSEDTKRVSNDLAAEYLALLSSGHNVFDYFEKHGIDEVSILADNKTANLIMDSVSSADTKIKHLYTLDMPFSVGASLGIRQYRFEKLESEKFSDGDVLFAAYMPGKQEMAYLTKAVPKNVTIIWLHTILHSLSTEHFFAAGIRDAVSNAGGGPIIILRLPTIRGLKSPSAADKALSSYNTAKLLTTAKQDIMSLPQIYTGVSFEKISQTAILPPTYLDKDDVWRFSDCKGKYMNIVDGMRHTSNQPEKYAGTVYIFGGSMAFGKLVSDDETIASLLQSSINLPLRVVNCTNFDGRMQAGRMLSIVNSISFRPNDVIIVAMEEDHTASSFVPYQFKYIDDTFIKADALSVLSKDTGAFYLNNVYSPLGNSLVAGLLKEKIYELVKLFE